MIAQAIIKVGLRFRVLIFAISLKVMGSFLGSLVSITGNLPMGPLLCALSNATLVSLILTVVHMSHSLNSLKGDYRGLYRELL